MPKSMFCIHVYMMYFDVFYRDSKMLYPNGLKCDIFYMYSSEKRGLVALQFIIIAGCIWGCYDVTIPGAPGDDKNIDMHDDVIKWKHLPRYWPFVRGIHRSPVNSPHKGQWRGALMFSLICVWINSWINNRKAGDLRRYRAHYDVTVMWS